MNFLLVKEEAIRNLSPRDKMGKLIHFFTSLGSPSPLYPIYIIFSQSISVRIHSPVQKKKILSPITESVMCSFSLLLRGSANFLTVHHVTNTVLGTEGADMKGTDRAPYLRTLSACKRSTLTMWLSRVEQGFLKSIKSKLLGH